MKIKDLFKKGKEDDNNFYSLAKIIFITTLAVAVLSWFVSSGTFEGAAITNASDTHFTLMTFFDGWTQAFNLFFVQFATILAVGGLYGVLGRIPTYNKIVSSLGKFVSKHKNVAIVITTVLFAGLSSITINILSLVIFIPFVITILTKAGVDKFGAFLTTFGAIMVGMMGATFTGYGMDSLYESTYVAASEYLLFNSLILVVGIAVVSFFTILRQKDVKKENLLEERFDEKEVSGKTNTVPVLVTIGAILSLIVAYISSLIFKDFDNSFLLLVISLVVVYAILFFVRAKFLDSKKNKGEVVSWPLITLLSTLGTLIVVGFINWTNIFETSIFTGFHTWLTTDIVLNIGNEAVPALGFIFDSTFEIGLWEINYVIILALFFALVIAKSYSIKMKDTLHYFFEGMGKMLLPALLFVAAHVVTVLTSWLPMVNTIVFELAELTGGFNIFIGIGIGLLMAFFTADSFFMAYLIAGFIGGYYEGIAGGDMAFIIHTVYGFAQFILPTSILLLMGLNYCDIKYKDWFKASRNILLTLSLVLVIVFLFI